MNAVVEKVEELSNIEWLGQQLRAKTANYEANNKATDGKSVNWEDRCGAIAGLPSDESKAYASILVWGDYRDNTEQYKIVIDYVANCLFDMAQKDADRKRESFDMNKFCRGIARMELFYSLRPQLREYHTLKGRLVFSGIDYIEPNTYSKRYAWLGCAVELLLKELSDEIENSVGIYRAKLKRVG